MSPDELAAIETQGRKFATTLLNAGYDERSVFVASIGPALRASGLTCAEASQLSVLCTVDAILSDAYRRAARIRPLQSKGLAFLAGVWAEIEARR